MTLWCQAPPSMGFPRQEYCTGLPFPSPGDLPDPGMDPTCELIPVLCSMRWIVTALQPVGSQMKPLNFGFYDLIPTLLLCLLWVDLGAPKWMGLPNGKTLCQGWRRVLVASFFFFLFYSSVFALYHVRDRGVIAKHLPFTHFNLLSSAATMTTEQKQGGKRT